MRYGERVLAARGRMARAAKEQGADDDCHMGEPHAGERRDREVAAGPLAKQEAQRRGGNGIEGPGPRLREATQSHAFESPSPGECRGEQHCCERPDRSPGWTAA
jgi:hypothetical protein